MAVNSCRLLSNLRGTFQHVHLKSLQCLNLNSAFYSSISSEGTVFTRARNYAERIAIVDDKGSFTYGSILKLSRAIGLQIMDSLNSECRDDSLMGKKVAFLCAKDVSYVAVQWAIWRLAGIAVPLCETHPLSMLEYFLQDSESSLIVSSERFRSKITPLVKKLNVTHIEVPSFDTAGSVDREQSVLTMTPIEARTEYWDEMGAIIFYTSGTTGKPKGVLTTHGNVRAQVVGMVQAWEWNKDDCILHILPLHHVHGVINVLCCPLWVGATCILLQEFNPEKVWEYLTGSKLSLFMAVPTIYSKLIQCFQEKKYTKKEKEDTMKNCSRLRLMVSGSSALPEPIMVQWKNITGHMLLERYGMTEIGMALSNPLCGTRIPGSVGTPLPSVKVRIIAKDEYERECDNQVLVEGDEYSSKVFCEPHEAQGALQVKGPSVFKRYWGRPTASQESFTSDGWFRTGDIAEYKDNVYKIMGRSSVDIIKCGGYKISALDVERELLAHPCVRDIAVLGIPDNVWGQRVAALVSLFPGKSLGLEDIRNWSKERLSKYQTPSLLKIIPDIPRNTMGKVNKKQLVELFIK